MTTHGPKNPLKTPHWVLLTLAVLGLAYLTFGIALNGLGNGQ